MTDLLDPQQVVAAAARLEGIANRTPTMTSRTLDGIAGSAVFLKCESFQRVGAFKFRGAYNAVSQLSEAERAVGVITHSSGNHAQGLALAAQLHAVAATIVMPHDAPPNKRRATAAYGATIVECDAQDREAVTAELIERHGYTLIHPYDNDMIIAGQGTAALELFEERGPMDALFVPVGGGGLISGSALAAQIASPDCRVIGVEPAIAPDATESWRTGHIQRLSTVPDTVADGLRTRAVGERNLAIMRAYIADMITVSESDIMAALEFAWGRLKLVIEPSSAVALVPLLTGAYDLPPGSRAGVLLSGGNVDVGACGFLRKNDDERKDAAPASMPEKTTDVGQVIVTGPTPSRPAQPRILVTTDLQPELLRQLEQAGEVDYQPELPLTPVPADIAAYEALIAGPRQAVGADVLEYGYNIRVIGSIAFHPDNIDVSAARAMGAKVIFAPTEKGMALAEQTIARLVMLAGDTEDGSLDGKTLGLIGFGPVGRLAAERARAFGMNVLVNQPRLTAELALESQVRAADLNDLLAAAHFVSLHLPLHEETAGMIGSSELARMRRGAVLLNGGHPRLVDEAALLAALNDGMLAAAAVPDLLPTDEPAPVSATELRRHPRVRSYDPVVAGSDPHPGGVAAHVVAGVIEALETSRSPRSLDLEVVPAGLVSPHENIDHKRVARLMSRLEDDGLLVNPPITTYWKGRYVILDGATRYSALSGLGYPYIIVQVVPATHSELQLHTWYHAIASEDAEAGVEALVARLASIPDLALDEIEPVSAQAALEQTDALCYLKTTDCRTLLARARPGARKLATMNALVDAYNEWGQVERTLVTEMDRLRAQFPALVAVAIFPQFVSSDVFDAATAGDFLPAGLTRFVIPGRILRLNADLARLKVDEPLEDKRAWFEDFIASRLAQSRLRYYQEPVILLDE